MHITDCSLKGQDQFKNYKVAVLSGPNGDCIARQTKVQNSKNTCIQDKARCIPLKTTNRGKSL